MNLHHPDPECSNLDFVPLKPRAQKVRVAISNSFGFGGSNNCLVRRGPGEGSDPRGIVCSIGHALLLEVLISGRRRGQRGPPHTVPHGPAVTSSSRCRSRMTACNGLPLA